MVHVKKCPLVEKGIVKRRSSPSTEFYDGDKPMIYCYGYENPMYDEPLEECRKCLDWNRSDQVDEDMRICRERLEADND